MSNDRELLELAAKAAGLSFQPKNITNHGIYCNDATWWSPLDDDGDALRLAVKLRIRIGFRPCSYADTPSGIRCFGARDGEDINQRTRLSIVRAAAEIGRTMLEGNAA